MSNRFKRFSITTVVSLEICRSSGEKLKGDHKPDEGPTGNWWVCACVRE